VKFSPCKGGDCDQEILAYFRMRLLPNLEISEFALALS
jgi:hypothetical protein